MKTILPGSTIGILGGGQLGRMSTFKAKQMGYRVITLDPSPASACGQVADEQIVAGYTDEAALLTLGQTCDVITYEFENVSASALKILSNLDKPVFPLGHNLKISQNRLTEKTFIRGLGLNTADFLAVNSQKDLETAAAQIGFPAILKTCTGGYDGKGQFVLSTYDEALQAFESIINQIKQTQKEKGSDLDNENEISANLIWEKKIPFIKELSVICARNQAGEDTSYPVTENIHVNNILDISIAPARVSAKGHQAAQHVAQTIARGLDLVGVCGVELFLLADDSILVNEIAPRPHNSGHYTIEACPCSQFEQHIRAICNLPLGSTRLIANAVMVNIMGTGTGDTLIGLDKALQNPQIHLHLYGKGQARPNRKMGHLTALADDVEQALEMALEARKKIRWQVASGKSQVAGDKKFA